MQQFASARMQIDNESLISKYREVTSINNARLKQAKNIKDLVALKIQQIPQDESITFSKVQIDNALFSSYDQTMQSDTQPIRGHCETVKALKELFTNKDKQSARRPLTNHIMTKYHPSHSQRNASKQSSIYQLPKTDQQNAEVMSLDDRQARIKDRLAKLQDLFETDEVNHQKLNECEPTMNTTYRQHQLQQEQQPQHDEGLSQYMQQRLQQLKEKRFQSSDNFPVRSEPQFKASTLKNHTFTQVQNDFEMLTLKEKQQDKQIRRKQLDLEIQVMNQIKRDKRQSQLAKSTKNKVKQNYFSQVMQQIAQIDKAQSDSSQSVCENFEQNSRGQAKKVVVIKRQPRIQERRSQEPKTLESQLQESFQPQMKPIEQEAKVIISNVAEKPQKLQEPEEPQKVTGFMMQSFCPKRFNRFPRFSAAQGHQSLDHLQERTVCLNSELLGLNVTESQYDPFEKVVLFKDIDNQILTSFRTLKGSNNQISETQKVVHQKFNSQQNQSRFYKQGMLQMASKLPFDVLAEESLQEHDHQAVATPHDQVLYQNINHSSVSNTNSTEQAEVVRLVIPPLPSQPDEVTKINPLAMFPKQPEQDEQTFIANYNTQVTNALFLSTTQRNCYKKPVQKVKATVNREPQNLQNFVSQGDKGKVSGLIDEIYRKERMYVRNQSRDNILTISSPIFELSKWHNLKTFNVDQTLPAPQPKPQIHAQQLQPQQLKQPQQLQQQPKPIEQSEIISSCSIQSPKSPHQFKATLKEFQSIQD